MALIVEDGSCVANANAFVTRQELLDYASDYYPDTCVQDTSDTDAAIMRASSWLSTFPIWDGAMTCGRGLQGLAWPRTGVTDCNGDAVPSDEVPIEVKRATYLAAMAEITTPNFLIPTITPGKQVKREKVDVIEVEYQVADTYDDPLETLRPMLTGVLDDLNCMATFPDGNETPWPWVA